MKTDIRILIDLAGMTVTGFRQKCKDQENFSFYPDELTEKYVERHSGVFSAVLGIPAEDITYNNRQFERFYETMCGADGKPLLDLIEQRGMNVESFAHSAGMDPCTIRRYINGETVATVLDKLRMATALDVKPEEIRLSIRFGRFEKFNEWLLSLTNDDIDSASLIYRSREEIAKWQQKYSRPLVKIPDGLDLQKGKLCFAYGIDVEDLQAFARERTKHV